MPELGISYKPQKITPKFTGTVRELFTKTLGDVRLRLSTAMEECAIPVRGIQANGCGGATGPWDPNSVRR